MADTPPKVAIFCFRRDLRLYDNLGLQMMCKQYPDARVLPVFCLDPRQVSPRMNRYRSANAVRFMLESLADLHRALDPTGLVVVRGRPELALPALAKACGAVAVGWNDDVTPFSRARDAKIERALCKKSIPVIIGCEDASVVPVRTLLTQASSSVYKVFTPFCRAARARGVLAPTGRASPLQTIGMRAAWQDSLPKSCTVAPDASRLHELAGFEDVLSLTRGASSTASETSRVAGGREQGLRRLEKQYILSRCRRYADERDHPWEEKTTRLSAYLKFGCVSFREAHAAIEAALRANPISKEALTRELFWNAFYGYITWHFGDVLKAQPVGRERSQNMDFTVVARPSDGQPENAAAWRSTKSTESRDLMERWSRGETGFPFVDAAMRQLTTTGWMHNRARMVVASFLTKDLRIDWREGERFFAQHLVDYDPSSNNGGWQWAASTGADAQPFYRIFNPWLQSKKFDPKALYIKQHVPELVDVPARDIHKWCEEGVRARYANHSVASRYPSPIVEHAAAREEFLTAWKSAGNTS